MRHVCEYKGQLPLIATTVCETDARAEVTAEVVVYRYSAERVQTYLRTKVARLSHKDVSEVSRTLTRGFAKDGLMEDGKEDVLRGESANDECLNSLTISCT